MKILEFITSFISISNNILLDKVICATVLTISAAIAYKIGGWLGFKGKLGFVGWLICAALIYILLALIVKGVIWLAQNPVCVIIGVIVILIVSVCVVVTYHFVGGRKLHD